jgi:hypothetical protein
MARKRLTSLPDGLWMKLAELEDHVRHLDLIRGVGWTLSVASLAVAAGVVIDLCAELPVELRIGLLVSAALLTGLTFIIQIWRPVRRKRSDIDLAATVERANPQLRESLVSCIELYDSSIPEADRGSPLMRELAARQALHAAAPIDFCDSVASRPAHRMLAGSFVAWSLLLLPLLMPSGYRLLLARFFTPWQNHDRVASFWFDLERGNRVVARGSDVVLTAQVHGTKRSLPTTATLNWVDVNGEADSRLLDLDPATGTYTTTIPHVMQGFQYHLAAAGNRSREYQIRVVDGPAVTSFQLEIQPPAYTGQPAKVLDGPVGEISVFERSQLKWHLTFNKPLKSAEFVWEQDAEVSKERANSKPNQKVELTQRQSKEPAKKPAPDAAKLNAFQIANDGLSADLESVAEASGRFRFVIRDEFELSNESDLERHLAVAPDQPPALKLSNAESDLAQPSDVIPVRVQASDDIGLASLELHYEVDQGRQAVVRCPATELGRTAMVYTFSMPLADLHLNDGEIVSYRVRATDERPVPGPNETWSERLVIRIDSKADAPGTKDLAAEQEQLSKHLAQLRIDTVDNQQQIEDLKQKAEAAAKQPTAAESEVAKADREALEKATDAQDQLQSSMEQLASTLKQHPLFSKLTQSARQLAQEEFAKANDSLDQAEQAKGEDRAKPLGDAGAQLKQAEQKLAELDQQFEKLAKLERDLLELSRLAANADRLSERLKDLDKRKQQAPPADATPEEKQRRDEIQQAEEKQLLAQQQALAKRADELLRNQPDLQQSAVQNQLNQLSQLKQKTQDLVQPQREIAENLQAAAKESADKNRDLIEKQQELKQQAEKLQEQLAQAPLSKSPRPDPIDAEKLEQALADLKAGNLGAAAKSEDEIAEQLEKLEKELRKQAEEKSADSRPADTPPMASDKRPAALEKPGNESPPDEKVTSEKPSTDQSVDQKPQANQAAQRAADEARKLADSARDLKQQVERAKTAQNPANQQQKQEKLSENLRNLNEQIEATQERLSRLRLNSQDSRKLGDTKSGGVPAPDSKPGSGPPMSSEKQNGSQAGKSSPADEQKTQSKADGQQGDGSPAGSSPQQTAQQAMQRAADELAKGNLDESAKAGKKAADALSQAEGNQAEAGPSQKGPNQQVTSPSDPPQAKSADSGSPESEAGTTPDASQVPPEAANQVTDALDQLKNGPPAKANDPSSAGKESEAQAKSSQAGSPSPNASPKSSGTPGQSGKLAPTNVSGQSGETPSPGKSAPSKSEWATDSPQGSGTKPGDGQETSGNPGSARAPGKSSSGQPSDSKGSKPVSGQTGGEPTSPGGTQGGSAPLGGQPGGHGETGNATPSGPRGNQLQAAAQRLQQASQALKQAASQVQKQPGTGMGGQARGQKSEGQPDNEQHGDTPQDVDESNVAGRGQQSTTDSKTKPASDTVTDQQLQRLKRRMAGRKWGELSGTLQTEILQASQKKPNSEYGELIRQYFKEIAKSQPAAP